MFSRRAALRLLGLAMAAAPAAAAVLAEQPSDLAVTVYRAPHRNTGSIDVNDLQGFALVSEKRTVRLPAGSSVLKFAGVADGIEPASAIVTGLPGVFEKNRDAKLLSPAALVEAALGKPVELLRSNRKTGKTERLEGTIVSDADGGVVFQTAQGIEALRCSGLPETFSFEPGRDLSARPTLSVLVQSPKARTFEVTLSYLARGFDWAADYSAILSADGGSLDLGAWVTLANSNAVGFPSARTFVVAGKLNRELDEVQPIDFGRPILANCWPRGSTSDAPMVLRMTRGLLEADRAVLSKVANALSVAGGAAAPVPPIVQQEQLGDLKLYRVPDRTTVASRQSKQVRLMDRSQVPIATVYEADLPAGATATAAPAYRLIRTMNNAANHLGLPLPSGNIAVYAPHQGGTLLEHEAPMRDIAVDEELEIDMGGSADVAVSAVQEASAIDSAHAEMLPLLPGIALRSVTVDAVNRVDISNAQAREVQFELRLKLPPGARVVRADHPMGVKNGRPIFRLQVPANGSATLRYQTQQVADSAVELRR
ncbi:MAG: DUF4139 domain-containing protein [Steroidobacteraceae bacterium]